MFKFKSLVITFRLKYLFQDTNQRIENIVMEYSYDYLGYVSKDYFCFILHFNTILSVLNLVCCNELMLERKYSLSHNLTSSIPLFSLTLLLFLRFCRIYGFHLKQQLVIKFLWKINKIK